MANSAKVQTGLKTATKFAFTKDGELKPHAEGTVRRLLAVQRPAVLAYLRMLRRKNPDASPAEIADIVRKHYLWAATGGGAAVGATAVVPGLGTLAAAGVAAVETAGFLEASALYAQAITELHGLPVRDPQRANALVMGLMLGNAGKDLVKKFSAQAAGEGPALTSHWGPMVAKQIPAQMMDTLTKRMRKTMMRKYAARTGGSMVGRLMPFGIGAVIGGVVNHQMARTVVRHSRSAFDPYPGAFPHDLDPKISTPKADADLMGGLKHLIRLLQLRKSKGQVIPGEVIDPVTADSQILVHEGAGDFDPEAPRTYQTGSSEAGGRGSRWWGRKTGQPADASEPRKRGIGPWSVDWRL